MENPEPKAERTDRTVETIKVIRWPCVVLFGLVLYYSSISSFFKDMNEADFTKDGVKLKRVIASAAYLGAAEASQPLKEGEAKQLTPTNPLALSAASVKFQDFLLPNKHRNLEDAKILWLDPHPQNNAYERQAFIALGIHIDSVSSAQEALAKLKSNHYNLLISNFGRPEDKELSGYGLLPELKKLPSRPPVIIYSASARNRENAPERQELVGETDSPSELLTLVLNTLNQG